MVNVGRAALTHVANSMPPWELLSISQEETSNGRVRITSVALPCSLLLYGSLATLGVIYMRARRKRAWLMLGKCKRCGYDLRATPGLCPECGPTPSRIRATGPERYNPLAGATEFLTLKGHPRARRARVRADTDGAQPDQRTT